MVLVLPSLLFHQETNVLSHSPFSDTVKDVEHGSSGKRKGWRGMTSLESNLWCAFIMLYRNCISGQNDYWFLNAAHLYSPLRDINLRMIIINLSDHGALWLSGNLSLSAGKWPVLCFSHSNRITARQAATEKYVLLWSKVCHSHRTHLQPTSIRWTQTAPLKTTLNPLTNKFISY